MGGHLLKKPSESNIFTKAQKENLKDFFNFDKYWVLGDGSDEIDCMVGNKNGALLEPMYAVGSIRQDTVMIKELLAHNFGSENCGNMHKYACELL